MSNVETSSLGAGEVLHPWMAAGAEVYCLSGAVRVEGVGMLPARVLRVGQRMRVDAPVRLTVVGVEASRVRVLAGEGAVPEGRRRPAGGWRAFVLSWARG